MGKHGHLTGIDKIKYEMKMRVLHKGACSSPRLNPGDTECTCPRDCPLHGRCCDCIAHHKEERLENTNPVAGDINWMPYCLACFDQNHHIGSKGDSGVNVR